MKNLETLLDGKKDSEEMTIKELLQSFGLKELSPSNFLKMIENLNSKNISINSVGVESGAEWQLTDDAKVILKRNEDSDKQSKEVFAEAWYTKESSYSKKNDKDNAMKCLQIIQEINPADSVMWQSIGLRY